MERRSRIVDHLLSDVIGDGDISDLPGAGKPLLPTEDSHTPQDQRAAFKIMQDNDVLPEWMTLAKAVGQSESQLRAEVETKAKALSAAYGKAGEGSAGTGGKRWSRYLSGLNERIERHNRDVLLHNLTVPRGIPHRSILNSDKLIGQALTKARRGAEARRT